MRYAGFVWVALFFLVTGTACGQTSSSADFSDFGFANAQVLPGGNIDSNISFTTEKNSSGTNPTYYVADGIRFYYHSGGDGGSITLHTANGVEITKVELYAFSGSYTPTVKYNVDGSADATANLSGTTYTIEGISAGTSLKIRNGNTANVQLRLTGLTVWYNEDSSCSLEPPSGAIEGATPECDYSFVTYTGDAAPEGVTYYWQVSAYGTDTEFAVSTGLDVYETGDFYVRAKTDDGDCWSDAIGPFHVDINHAPAVDGAGQPQDQTAAEGGNATFSVQTTEGGDFLYQWYISTDNGANWEAMDGEESAVLNLTGVTQAMNGYSYRVYILNDCGDLDSDAATLTVTEAPCFSEDFSDITTGNNTSTSGSSTAWTGNDNFPIVGTAYRAGGAVKIGSSSNTGFIESKSLDDISGNITVNIMVKGWTTVEGDLKVSIDGQEEILSYTAVMADSFEKVSVSFTGVAAGSNLKIETTSRRAFIDNVEILCEESEEPVSCPELNEAPANVTFDDSIVLEDCTVEGGVFYAPEDACPEGSVLQYSVNDGASWSNNLPLYKLKKSMTVITRCSCEEDETVVSPSSAPVTTNPGDSSNCKNNSYTATSEAAPATGGNITEGNGTYQWGKKVKFKAEQNEGYKFANWTVDDEVVSVKKAYPFFITQDTHAVANFTPKDYAVKTKSAPGVGGSTTGDGTYAYDSEAMVTATANEGYTFVNWTDIDGNVVSTDTSYSFTVSGKAKLTANFVKATLTVTTSSSPAEGGTTTGDGTYEYNKKATVTATASEGYKFVNWTIDGNEVSVKKTYKFNVTENVDLVANFVLKGNHGGGAEKGIESDVFSFSYYPNPVKDILYIDANSSIQSIEVYNLASQKVMSLNAAKAANAKVDVRTLSQGVYVFRVAFDNGEVKTFKIVKK